MSEEGGQTAEGADFEEFYQAAYAPLVGQLLAVTGSVEQAEDVVQEAFARAMARWSQIAAYEVPALWVRRVAINLALNELRRARRRMKALLRLDAMRPQVQLSAESTGVVEILRRVPLNQRPVLLLHCVLDLPIEEVARQLGLTEGTVRGRLARARARLAAQPASDLEGASSLHD